MKAPANAVEVGRRVYLRYPTARDRVQLMALKVASRTFLEPWEGTPTDGLDMFSDAWFARYMSMRRGTANHRFLICLRENRRIAGIMSLGHIVRGAFQSCYIGYWTGQPFARRGYTTEALGLTLRFVFRTLKLHRVEANIVPRNRASKGLVRKLGFRYEGTAKRYLSINHRWEDHEHWAITREEWRVPRV